MKNVYISTVISNHENRFYSFREVLYSFISLDDIIKKYDGSSIIDPTRYYIPLKTADGFKFEIMIMFGLDGSTQSNWKNRFCKIKNDS